jgi:cysteine desulfurase
MKDIYLDHNATTPVLQGVLTAMLPFFEKSPGNPSSVHTAGGKTRIAIERARDQIADFVGAPPDNVLFTSSAAETINTALHSAIQGKSVLASLLSPLSMRLCSDKERDGGYTNPCRHFRGA